jgi:hypothetical protein
MAYRSVFTNIETRHEINQLSTRVSLLEGALAQSQALLSSSSPHASSSEEPLRPLEREQMDTPQSHYQANSVVSTLWTYIYIPILLALPLYYSSRASGVSYIIVKYSSEYEEWAQIASPPNRPANGTQFPPLAPAALPESLLKVKEAWASFLGARVAEWKVVFTLALLLAA